MISASPTEYVADASVLVAYFVETDEHHDKVLPYWDELRNAQVRFHIPALAIVEAAGVINRRSSRTHMVSAIETLRELTGLGYIVQYPLDEKRINHTLSILGRYNLLGADAVYCSLAEELGVGVLSTDGDFRRYTTAIVL